MNDSIAIRASGLRKQYRIGSGRRRHDSLRDLIADQWSALFARHGRENRGPEFFWALEDATFDIRRGENVGIIGLNGAGKSTLLKILSRITTPTSGSATITGRVGALLEVGTGFHGELTGRENVQLYGSILGMTNSEVARKFDAIVAFSGIEAFIDTPVKRYSSGMYVRLAFSVAAHLEPEILLLDEVLAVGDVAFQRKCMDLAKDLQRRNATILFVSHNMFSIKSMCERVIYLRKGRVVFDGPTERGIELYEKDCRLSTLPYTEDSPGDWPIEVTGCELLDDKGVERTVFEFGDRVTVRIRYRAGRHLRRPNFIIVISRADGIACCNFCTESDRVFNDDVFGEGVIALSTPPLNLVAEMYTVSVLVREEGWQKLICSQVGTTFHVRHELYDRHFGVFHDEAADWTWSQCNAAQESDSSGIPVESGYRALS